MPAENSWPSKTNGSSPGDGVRTGDTDARPSAAAYPVGAPTEEPGGSSSPRPGADCGIVVTLALIGGKRLLREAAAGMLAAQDGLDVSGAFASVSDFLAAPRKSTPAVVLLDCDGGEPGECRQAVEKLRSSCAESRIVLLCQEIDEEAVHCAITQLVSGVVLKSYSTEDMCAAIGYTAGGRTIMPAGWQRAIGRHPGGHTGLSPRHREILALIADGRRNEEIARELNLSPNTVKFHIRAIYARIGVRNRVEAAGRHALMTSGEA